MPEIVFTVTTEAAIKRLELDEVERFEPIDLIAGVGKKTRDSGYQGVAVLYLQGQVGQGAKLKITQKVGNETVTLAERNHIKITSTTGKSVSFIAFRVR